MKKMKQLTAALLALAMALGLAACNPSSSTPSGAPENSGTPEQSAPPAVQSADLEELGSGDVKWKEETTADGWVKVTNEGGDTLGYSKSTGVTLLQSDGFAFKDLNRNGVLDPYEDWRLDNETRARDLANQMSGEEIAPYLTHGGWDVMTTDKNFFTDPEKNPDYAYILGGGRGGVTWDSDPNTEGNVDHAIWVNMMQELCESLDYGIPALVSIDPNNQSGIIESMALAATMSPELAFEIGQEYSKQWRAMGASLLLGPQVDLMTSPVMDRGTGTYGEDPALTRDITEAFISGLQSTFSDTGEDKGWGSDSVMSVVKHYAGAGASEGGRDDHNSTGKYAVFPNNNFEAHIIAFHDGAFALKHSSTGAAGGVMMNYSISYSKDGSLGELIAGAWSEFKYNTLFSSGWNGFIVSDWGPISGSWGSWGMEDYTDAERAKTAILYGMTQLLGYNDVENMIEAWKLLCDDLGEEKALQLMQDRAYENLLVTMRLGLFENPYNSTDHVREVCFTDEARAYGVETQLDSIVMVKNSGNLIKESEGSKKLTVYIPWNYTYPSVKGFRRTPTASYWAPSIDLDAAAKYYNVVTDTPADPSGPADEDGKATYTENDIIRASAADIAACDMILAGMDSPQVRSYSVTKDDGSVIWLPPSIQYNEYTAATAKETSVAGDQVTETTNDGYTQQIRTITENRSYKGQTIPHAATYGHLEALQYATSAAPDKPVVVLMNMSNGGSMVFSEMEPLADAILVGYKGVTDEAFLKTVAGEHEPNGLLVAQMPASMEAVEAQKGEDLPRDLECYVDADGNVYDFAYGLNWSGRIDDQRVKTYSAEPLTECENLDFKYANQ